MHYTAHIDELFNAATTRGDGFRDMSPLFAALGCRCLVIDDEEGWCVQLSSPPGPQVEVFIAETLLRLLRSKVNELSTPWTTPFSLLDGLSQNGRWRLCTRTVSDSRLLADLLFRFKYLSSDFSGNTHTRTDVRKSVQSVANPILAAWLGLPGGAADFPTLEVLAGALFGAAWYEFSLEGMRPIDARAFVRQQCPPFRTGLVIQDKKDLSLALPKLDQSMGMP